MPAEPPIIVLVRPQLGENIGKAARAMLNFGLVAGAGFMLYKRLRP